MKVEIAWGDVAAAMFLGAHNRQFRNSSSARGVRVVVRHFKSAGLRRKFERGEITHAQATRSVTIIRPVT